MTSSPSQNPSSNPTNTPSNNVVPSSIPPIVITPAPTAPVSSGSGPTSTSTPLFTNISSPQHTPTSGNPFIPPSTPAHTQGSSASKAQQWLAAYTLLSPDSKARAAKAFDAIKPADAAPSIIFSTNKEIKMSSTLDSTYGLGIHPTINDLAKAGQYLPLILFTDDMTKRLHRGGLTLKKIKSTIGGITHHLLDLSAFPAEDSLDAFTWHEAWKRYLSWLQDPNVAQPEVHERWFTHYSFLSKDEAIRSNFKAILTFDMNWRASYAAQPFIHDPVEWQLRLQVNHSSLITYPFLISFQSRQPRVKLPQNVSFNYPPEMIAPTLPIVMSHTIPLART
ncbi:hypothetical protein L210DRAFT_3648665 [Boletus edulis BED1]|uniref:Uncharacterized protein n=1 Tax=Boletus edulis BED1 TaxID=1328754 RepID=A0AAD4GBD1_BOLED|nr:hypothetical protein L210DRAFT_3648665 [Boletus edulis BED1]